MNLTHPTYKIMLNQIRQILRKKSKLSILDYGCGSGYLLTILNKKIVKKYVGYETSENAVNVAVANFNKVSNAKFELIDTKKKLNFKQKNFDLVIAIGVLQYMTDKQIMVFIEQASKSLKKGGDLLISTVSDHLLYRVFNLYGIFLPNRFINRKNLLSLLRKNGLDIQYNIEKGLLFGPLFYHNFVLAFDFLDKVMFRTKGTLGPFGRNSRKLAYFIAEFEYSLPVDFGYTIYVRAIKK